MMLLCCMVIRGLEITILCGRCWCLLLLHRIGQVGPYMVGRLAGRLIEAMQLTQQHLCPLQCIT
jgi:hypothetical protein